MQKNKASTAQAILSGQDNALQHLYQQKQKIDTLNQTLRTLLPKNYQQHVSVINVSQGVLNLGATNSSIASQLHFDKSTLLSQLRQNPAFCDLIRIEHTITQRAHRPTTKKTQRFRQPISKNIVPMLRAMMTQTKTDTLKASFSRLVSKLRESAS